MLDAHVHLWDTEVFALPWLAAVPEFAARYELADARSEQMTGVICVQAGESLREAAWLVAQASRFPTIRAVVLQYAPSDGELEWGGDVHPELERSLVAGGPVAGVRIPARAASDDLSTIPGIDALCDGLDRNELVLELLVRPAQLASVAELAARFPSLTMVICHAGIGQDPVDDNWVNVLEALGAHANVNAKISGVIPLANDSRQPDAPQRIVRAALRGLGADRLMFGSDWPISLRTGLVYDAIADRIRTELEVCSAEESAQIFGGTARRVYGVASCTDSQRREGLRPNAR